MFVVQEFGGLTPVSSLGTRNDYWLQRVFLHRTMHDVTSFARRSLTAQCFRRRYWPLCKAFPFVALEVILSSVVLLYIVTILLGLTQF